MLDWGNSGGMERLHKLLFELSSPERITTLRELQENRLKLTQLARKLNLTLTEASRHLQRLTEADLIQRDNNGYFTLTRFGTLTLSLLSGLGFASKHREYFLEYDTSGIPHQLIERIGELEESEYSPETFRNIEEGQNRIREAREFTWILSDQVLTSSVPALAEKVKNPFDLRIILPDGKFPPENKSQLPSMMGVRKRVLQKVDALVVMTEKYAVFCLPNRSGRIDYTGFTGTDANFLKWCQDLFLYYWEKAKPHGSG